MINVAVIIITYRRPLGLIRVLEGLDKQQCSDQSRCFRVSAIVVDNDKEHSAAASVEQFRLNSPMSVRYIMEEQQGIPIARNAGIAAVPDDAEFFCFIDDDEWPGETWIDELLKTQRATGADCVLGAVIPVYPESAPRWLVSSHVFDSWQFPDNAQLTEAASNNVLISHEFIRRTKLRFEERMRMTGGSDFLFFRQAVGLGMRIVWSAGAPVYEEVPMSRLKLRWIIQRQYRLGNTFSVSERLTGTRVGLAKLVVKGFIRIGFGVVMLPALLFSPYYGMRAIVHILRGAGTIAGAFGHAHQEYSLTGLALDRSERPSK
ncbi:MAG: glycosyltransferase family 2 protein [Gammaproteobacteria bacterium]|nr:glycosyltransferase family 2 protein [Gammaproteobacteria bacterium]MBU1775615.1 glycosyltransferase family 2 protein [Gammaproteobacteria bacterium]MBU1969736.1 glycosyltransferase family 2 protein [Gammaproteobacteria bacterium]